MSAVIVDDEQYVREHLRRLLESQGVTVVAEADTAARGLQLAEDEEPDLMFVDIQMPGLTGLQMAEAIRHLPSPPLIVFVTAFTEHAVTAFEQAALDYLVKPVSAERLAKTIVRARSRISEGTRSKVKSADAEEIATASPHRRLPIRDDYTVKLIRFEEINYAEAKDKRVFVETDKGSYRTYYTLKQLETILPADLFYRVHDSYIVNLGLIEELLFLGSNAYEIRISDNRRLPVSRSRYPDLQRRLGLG